MSQLFAEFAVRAAARRLSRSVQIARMSPTPPRRLSTPYREPGEIPAYSVLSRSGFPQDLMPVHLPPAEHSEHEGPGRRDRRHTITQYGYFRVVLPRFAAFGVRLGRASPAGQVARR